MSASVDRDRCPKSPDGRHRYDVTGRSSRVHPDGTEFRLVCLACHRHGHGFIRDRDVRWGRKGPDWLREQDGPGLDHATGTGTQP